MKKILLISALLTLALSKPNANALVVENISVTDTGLRHAEAGYGLAEAGGITAQGGVSTYGEASASGGTDAEASVRTFIQGGGSDTDVRIDIRTALDGVEYATSVERTLRSDERLETRIGTPQRVESAEAGGEASTSDAFTLPASSLTERLLALFSHIFGLFIFW